MLKCLAFIEGEREGAYFEMMTIEFFSSRPFLFHNHLAANDHVAFYSAVLVPGLWFLRGAGLLIFQRKKNTFTHTLLSLC